MSAEDWLRERGIEITRQGLESQPGQYARYPTSALPGPLPGSDIADQETQAVPSIVKLDLHINGDITEWPTGKLEDDFASDDDEDLALLHEIADVDAISPIAEETSADFAFAEESTMIIPVIDLPDITTTPTRRLVDADEA